MGNVFVTKVFELSQTTGYGEPVQKLFRFQDGEQLAAALILDRNGAAGQSDKQILLYTERGLGFRFSLAGLADTKKTGRRLMKVASGDRFLGFFPVENDLVLWLSQNGYAVLYLANEIAELSGAGKGVILQKIPSDDRLIGGCSVAKSSKVKVQVTKGGDKEIDIRSLTISSRAKRGNKVVKRGLPALKAFKK
jgi:DNA gyrase subunit A